MQTLYQPNALRILTVLTAILILKVTSVVVLGYSDYFPPNFNNDFLHGRADYFFGPYEWAFYTHIASGPVTLVLGLVLINESFRIRFPRWHRTLGKTQIATVLFLLAPSGLWLARYAQTGRVAATGFSALAIATAACALLGWRAAVRRRFVEHRQWMWRCFLLLSSAVVIRLIGGLALVFEMGAAWIYPASAWTSWIAPLVAYETLLAFRRFKRSSVSANRQLPDSAVAWPLRGTEMSARNSASGISSKLMY